jgi:hypothetical protein
MGFFQLGMCEFDPSQVSHAFFFLENILSLIRKARQMRAFLISRSLWRPMIELFGSIIPKSLQPNQGKLPFSGDAPWRPGFSVTPMNPAVVYKSMLGAVAVSRRSHRPTTPGSRPQVGDTGQFGS